VPLKLGSGPAVSVLAMLPVPWTVRKVPGSSVASGCADEGGRGEGDGGSGTRDGDEAVDGVADNQVAIVLDEDAGGAGKSESRGLCEDELIAGNGSFDDLAVAGVRNVQGARGIHGHTGGLLRVMLVGLTSVVAVDPTEFSRMRLLPVSTM